MFKDAPKNLGLINYGTPTSDYLNASEKKQSRFADFFNNIGGIGGASMLTGAISGLGSLIVGSINANEQNKSAKESARMAKEQFELEKQRYNAREQERLQDKEAIDTIAKNNADIMTRF